MRQSDLSFSHGLRRPQLISFRVSSGEILQLIYGDFDSFQYFVLSCGALFGKRLGKGQCLIEEMQYF